VDWTHPEAARFKAAMDDDFNTPEAMAVLFDLANDVNKNKSSETASLLKNLGGIVGLLERKPNEFLQGKHYTMECEPGEYHLTGSDLSFVVNGYSSEEIEAMILVRIDAKKEKNFAEADRIRKELSDARIILEDTSQGTTWRRA
jgi:cysteinyl-tRNA synthetase